MTKEFGEEEAKELVMKQRKVMAPWAYMVAWADNYCQLAKREVAKKHMKLSVKKNQQQMSDFQKDIEHNNIILENFEKDNLENYLRVEGAKENDAQTRIRNSQKEFSDVNGYQQNIFKTFERHFFEKLHNECAE
jgi:hypothetical protein